jgi:putative hydrolase of the HAD superfamily
MAKHILFDIDDTLFPSTEFAELARKNALRAMIRMGLPFKEEKLSDMLNSITKEMGANYEGHFDELMKRLNIKRPARYVSAAIGAYHDTKAAIQPYPEVPLVLLTLKGAGKKLYIASDGLEVKQWDKLIRMQIGLFFNDVFVSEEMGIGKEKTEFYTRIVKKLGTKPEECLMVGDREERDIIPAKKAGIKTFRIFRGKYAKTPGKTTADYSGDNLRDMLLIKEI